MAQERRQDLLFQGRPVLLLERPADGVVPVRLHFLPVETKGFHGGIQLRPARVQVHGSGLLILRLKIRHR